MVGHPAIGSCERAVGGVWYVRVMMTSTICTDLDGHPVHVSTVGPDLDAVKLRAYRMLRMAERFVKQQWRAR